MGQWIRMCVWFRISRKDLGSDRVWYACDTTPYSIASSASASKAKSIEIYSFGDNFFFCRFDMMLERPEHGEGLLCAQNQYWSFELSAPKKPLYQLYFWHLKSMWIFYLVFIFGVVWYRTRDRQPLPLRTRNLAEQKFQVLLKSWSIPIICILKNSTNLRVSTCIMISPSPQTRN